MSFPLPVDVSAGSTVLLLAPRSEDADEACLRLIGGDEPRRRDVVALAVGRSAGSFLDSWIEYVGHRPADMRIVDVGTDDRSVDSSTADRTGSNNVVRSVEDLQDLDEVRSTVAALLEGQTGPDGLRLFYLDSLSAEVRQLGPTVPFRFLTDARDLVRRAGCVGFVRVDPAAHSDRTIGAMADVADVAIEPDAKRGGERWAVRTAGRPVAHIEGAASGPSLDDIFELLSDRRRRLALRFLVEATAPTTTEALARRIADVERSDGEPPSDETLSRIYTGLVHVHLPKLRDHGVVTVAADGGSIRLGEPAERLLPLLNLPTTDDLEG